MGPKGHELGVIVRAFPLETCPCFIPPSHPPLTRSRTSARGYGLPGRALGSRVQQH
jgi:hypothetical protein